MDDLGWQALAAALTISGGAWTFYAAKNRGAVSALRGAGVTLLFPAAYFTGTLEMCGEIASAVASWATGFVFSPLVWLGLVLAGVGVLLLVASGWLAARGGGAAAVESGTAPKAVPKGKGAAPAVDDDLADIEAILKSRGIA